jgi:hypothetical protein
VCVVVVESEPFEVCQFCVPFFSAEFTQEIERRRRDLIDRAAAVYCAVGLVGINND